MNPTSIPNSLGALIGALSMFSGRGPRRRPWETPARVNPACPSSGDRVVPSTPDDAGAIIAFNGAIEVEADYSENPAAKEWIAWIRANYRVGYVRCAKSTVVARCRYWNEFTLHDCTRKLSCHCCGAKLTLVEVDGAPDDE